MTIPRSLIHAFTLAAVTTLIAGGVASAAQVLVYANSDGFVDEVDGRGTHLQNWMPVLDGSVYFDAERGVFLVKTNVRPGGQDFNGPVIVTADAGARCVETGNPPHAKVYVFDCLEHVPKPPMRGLPDA